MVVIKTRQSTVHPNWRLHGSLNRAIDLSWLFSLEMHTERAIMNTKTLSDFLVQLCCQIKCDKFKKIYNAIASLI